MAAVIEQSDDEHETEREAEQARAAAAAENHAALERAVADLPDVPGQQEFLTLCQLARVMAGSGVVPKALRDKPADVLVVLMTGRDLGIPVTAALRKVYVIDGQPSIAPQLKLSLIRKKGLGRVVPHPHNERLVDRQGAIPLGPGGSVEWDRATDEVTVRGALGETYWYTWDDAVRAGLARRGCTPDSHTAECDAGKRNRNVYQTNDVGLANFCKDNWRKNPRRLLWQRASGFCADDYFSEATLGLYDPDELGAILDDDGQLIDANHVELPPGFARDAAVGGEGDAGEGMPADPGVAWGVQLRVHALPEDAQAEYRQRWKQAKIPGTTWRFPAGKQGLVESLLRGVEQQWKAQGRYDPEAGPAEFAARVLAPAVTAASALCAPRATAAAPFPPREATQTARSGPQQAGVPVAAPAATAASHGAQGGFGGGGDDGALPLGVPSPAGAPLDVPGEVRSGDAETKGAWVVAAVKAMPVAQVDDTLRGYGRDTKGSPTERRSRLALVILDREFGLADTGPGA